MYNFNPKNSHVIESPNEDLLSESESPSKDIYISIRFDRCSDELKTFPKNQYLNLFYDTTNN